MPDQRLDTIKEEIRRLDPDLDPDTSNFQTAVILMCAAFVTGPDTVRLVEFTGYPPGIVAAISRRMHQAGLWKDGVAKSDHWFKGDRMTNGIWTDSLVALGLAIARQREDGEWEYRALKRSELQ